MILHCDADRLPDDRSVVCRDRQTLPRSLAAGSMGISRPGFRAIVERLLVTGDRFTGCVNGNGEC
jgi:hypothetical protein